MCEARLAGSPAHGTPHHSRRADLRARDADGPCHRSLQAGEAIDLRDLFSLARCERRQETRKAATQERLTGAGWPDEEDRVTAGRRDLQGALRGLLALDEQQVGGTAPTDVESRAARSATRHRTRAPARSSTAPWYRPRGGSGRP